MYVAAASATPSPRSTSSKRNSRGGASVGCRLASTPSRRASRLLPSARTARWMRGRFMRIIFVRTYLLGYLLDGC